MKPKDSDTFIDIGVSITRLLLIASGQGTAASLIGEGAGLIKNLGSGGQRAVSAEKIAADVADQLFREHQDISEADWQVAATHVAPLIDRLSEKDRLAAGYDWTVLCPVLLELGGAERRRKLADESARRAFDWVLDVACQRIADLFTEKEALASLLKKVNEDCARLQRIERLLDRPGVQETSVVINDHIDVLRHLVPDALVDREQELADLEAFVRSSDDVWYAMEADMVSGKTAVMASFALNPPDDVHMASFFIRRIGGDGSDRGSFAFVMSAQLAKILGHEYTEPVRDPAQHTEFRQLLRRAAAACRSEIVPRPLVLLIDGIDEDSYFDNPDGADAKSILSLLPRRLPEGVKIITASRPNPRLPEDVICDADRRIVSLKPSPIAEKSINRKDMKIFFKSDVAVDIGAFLAACGGVLTVEDLRRLLTMRGHQRIRTWDVREYVDRSPGRILTPINVGFGGQEVLAYRLGHDVVTRAVIRELDPDSFGEGDEPEDERWWVPIREKALAPYRAIIRNWVKERANRGWDESTPSYVLSGACFDLMLNDKKDDSSSVRVVLDRGRYDEMRRRSVRRSHVLRMIDRECFTILNMNRGELPEDATASIFEVAESRKLLVRASTYIPGLPKLYVSYFNIAPEVALDMIMAVDEPKDRLGALRETMKAAIESGRGYAFLMLFLDAIGSLVLYQDIRDGVLRLLADVLVFIGNVTNDYKVGDNESIDLGGWLNEVLVSIKMEESLSRSLSSIENVDGSGKDAHVIEPFLLIAEDVAGRIEEPEERAEALVEVVGALARAGLTGEALAAAGRIEEPEERARALVEVVGALARAGLTGEALAAAGRIEGPGERVWALVEVVGALARAGLTGEALAAAGRIEGPRARADALAEVVGALARAGDAERARRVAEEAVSTAERIEGPWARVWALAGVAGALARAGLTGEALAAAGRIEGPRARVRALVGVAGALARAGDAERARRVAEEAVSTAERIEGPWARVRALAGVAGALARAGLTGEAFAVAERIEGPGERARALVGVAGALARAGDAERARRVAEEAVSTAERIEGPWARADALAGVAGALARAGLTGEALAVAERIEEPWARADALVGVAGALARAGDAERARRVAEEAVSTAERIEEPWARADALVGVAGALARAGLTGEALAVAERIEEPWARADALVGVAGALARAGDAERARRVAEEAVSTAERIEGPRARADALVGVAGALARAGDAERARRVAEEAVSTAERIEGPGERVRALAEVAGALARAGDAERARRVAEEAVSTAERISGIWKLMLVPTLAEAACALTRADLTDEALAVTERIKDLEGRARALAGVAEALARAGAIDEAREIVTTINEPGSRSRAQSAVIEALVRKGSSNEAVDMLRAALAEVEGFVSRQDAADCCATLAAACVDAADFLADSADAEPAERDRWLGLARSALARSWLYGASVWNRFDVLLRVAPDLATRLVEERLLADPEPSPGAESRSGSEPRPSSELSSDPDPEGPGGGTPSSR